MSVAPSRVGCPSLLADVEMIAPPNFLQRSQTALWSLNLKATLSLDHFINGLRSCLAGTSQVCGPGHLDINFSL